MLPKTIRLNQEKDILSVLRYGRKISGKYVDLRFRRSKRITSRFGFVVSKKVHNKPTKRNLIKRRMREIIYKGRREAQQTHDYLFIARPSAQKAPYRDLEADLTSLLSRSKQFTKSKNT